MRVISPALTAVFAVLVFSAIAAAPASAHPLFLTESGNELLIGTVVSGAPTLRAVNVGVLGTIKCGSFLVRLRFLRRRPYIDVEIIWHTKCEQTIGPTKSTCTEPITFNQLGELGLVLGNKTVGLLLAPTSGTTWGTVTCGGLTTTLEGAVVGEFPEINKKGVNQYNKELTEYELVFEAEGKNSENQKPEAIELLGTSMTKVELKVSGFFGGKASLESTLVLKPDGGVEICTLADSACP